MAEPVTAEIVPPPPSPWRFGLRAIFGLMAVCSVQFAVMSYLGVLTGFVLGTLACAAMFGVLLVAGIVLPGKDSRLLPTLDLLVVRIMLALVVLMLGTILAGGGTAAYYAAIRVKNETFLKRDLGLSLQEEMFLDRGQIAWGLRITAVQAGSVAHKAGLQQGEVIVVSGTIDEFYEILQTNRGKDVDVNVASGVSPGLSLQNCPQRSVTLAVPK